MADYIKREDAIACCGVYLHGSGLIAEDIKQLPAADVSPVRHGRWVWDDRCGDYFCSECWKQTGDWHDEVKEFDGKRVIALVLPYYCGYCGAKMDEEG